MLRTALLALPLLALPSLPCHAQIYKWVDAQGHTHYSDNKEEAGKARVAEVKLAPAPPAPSADAVPDWKQREAQFERDKKTRAAAEAAGPAPRPHSPYNYRSETDAAKCGLARDILSGAARHMNGKPVDAYDRDVASADVKNFCK